MKFYSFLVMWNVISFENVEHTKFYDHQKKVKWITSSFKKLLFVGGLYFKLHRSEQYFKKFITAELCTMIFPFLRFVERYFSPVNAIWVVLLTVCKNFLGRYGSLIITTISLLASFVKDDDDDDHHHVHFRLCKEWENQLSFTTRVMMKSILPYDKRLVDL